MHFDEERDLWYADIRYRHPEVNRPYFLRLGLVRYQFGSTFGCETSRIVTTDWIPVPQSQTVTVTALNDAAALVSVAESRRSNRRFTATLEQRLFDLPQGNTLPPMDIPFRGLSRWF